MKRSDLKKILEEAEPYLPKPIPSLTDADQNLEKLSGITNNNYRLYNLFIRVPRTNLNPFFNRRAEFHNIELMHKADLTEYPLYFNMETGFMIHKYTSPEIYFEKKLIDNDVVDKSVKVLNNINKNEIPAQESFDMQTALEFIRSKDIISSKDMLWVEDFHRVFFREQDRRKLEFSHNDPDISNFTVTQRAIDFEYSGMSPALSDLCNMYSMYLAHIVVENYLLQTEAPFKEMQPLTVFWLFFWGLWGVSKNYEDIPSDDYLQKAEFRVNAAVELLKKIRS